MATAHLPGPAGHAPPDGNSVAQRRPAWAGADPWRLIGATLGIAVGIFLAVLVTQALSDEGLVFALPFGTLAVFVLVAIAAGVLGAIFPARRVSRLNVLEALQYE
jgi:uncharacterized protein YacL